jgi:two-component system CheB/CheR fusion protein
MRVLEEFEPQVLVSDIAMPREDGYSLLRRIRALGPEQGGDIPALALTALAGEDDRQRALSAGFQMHLAKPVDFDRLEAALMELCERARRPRSVGHYEEQSRHA